MLVLKSDIELQTQFTRETHIITQVIQMIYKPKTQLTTLKDTKCLFNEKVKITVTKI